MPVPKRRHSRCRTNCRRSQHDKIVVPHLATCSRCGAAKLPHRICPECGWYKDREVIVTPSTTTS